MDNPVPGLVPVDRKGVLRVQRTGDRRLETAGGNTRTSLFVPGVSDALPWPTIARKKIRRLTCGVTSLPSPCTTNCRQKIRELQNAVTSIHTREIQVRLLARAERPVWCNSSILCAVFAHCSQKTTVGDQDSAQSATVACRLKN